MMKKPDDYPLAGHQPNPLGSSYPVELLAQLESEPRSRELFRSLPEETQLKLIQANTMAPEVIARLTDKDRQRQGPAAALLGEDDNSEIYCHSAPSQVKEAAWKAKFPKEGER